MPAASTTLLGDDFESSAVVDVVGLGAIAGAVVTRV
jgi:hypothetical protein